MEYLRRLEPIRKSELKRGNKMETIKTRMFSLIIYGIGVKKWTGDELNRSNRKTTKFLTRYEMLQPIIDTGRLYVSRNTGRQHFACKHSIRAEEYNGAWYVSTIIESKNVRLVQNERFK